MERHYLGHGVAIQKRGRTWAVDIYWKGRRMVRSLGTTDEDVAREIGYRHVNEIKRHELQIEQDICVLDNATRGVPSFFLDSSDPRRTQVPIMGSDQIQSIAREAVVAGLERLKRRAYEGVDLPTIIRDTITQVLAPAKAPPAAVTVEDSLKSYSPVRRSKSRAKDGSYLKNTESQIRKFTAWGKVSEIGAITPDLISRYLVHTREKEALSDKSAKDRYDIIRQWLDWEVGRGNLDKNPAMGLEPAKPKRNPVVYFKAPEVSKILEEVADDPYVNAVVRSAIFAGLRKGELFRLNWAEVDLAGRSITVTDTKTGEPRVVPILDQLLPALNALPKDKSRVFARWEDEDAFGRIVHRAVRRATGKEDGLQAMRRSFVTHILLLGVSPHVAAKWAGHDVAVQQKRYAGIVSLGEEPITMTWHDQKLEPHGLPRIKSQQRSRQGEP